jgi:hypothetical protein
MSSSLELVLGEGAWGHDLPLYLNASPLPETAMQNDEDAHETEVRSSGYLVMPGVSIGVGELHELPLSVSAYPARSIAAQNDGDGHETDVSEPLGSCGSGGGGVHELPPLNVWYAYPLVPTTAQNDDDGHDTDPGAFLASMGVLPDHPPVANADEGATSPIATTATSAAIRPSRQRTAPALSDGHKSSRAEPRGRRS